MAEIENCTLDCGCGRALRALDFAGAKSAFAEIESGSLAASEVAHG